VLERGQKLGAFSIPQLKVVENILPLMCSAWALKRWNLAGVSKSEYTRCLTQFVLQGIGAIPNAQSLVPAEAERQTTQARPYSPK
jgi:hypothetical protein